MTAEKKSDPAGTEIARGREDANQDYHKGIITPKKSDVNMLRDLRKSRGIPAKEVVALVRESYPKYDKTLQSKVESNDYGIALVFDAMDAVIREFAPDLLPPKKERWTHRLKNRVQCRLDDETYERLMATVYNEGFPTMQSWLSYRITSYLRSIEK